MMSKLLVRLLLICLHIFCYNGIEILYGPDDMIYETILNDWFVKESDIGDIYESSLGYYTLGGDMVSLRLNGPDNEMHLIDAISTLGYKNIRGILF